MLASRGNDTRQTSDTSMKLPVGIRSVARQTLHRRTEAQTGSWDSRTDDASPWSPAPTIPQECGDAARNRVLLMDAARRLIAERGVDAVTIAPDAMLSRWLPFLVSMSDLPT
jgi:hypothetical protein